jgi:hypothetical protein
VCGGGVDEVQAGAGNSNRSAPIMLPRGFSCETAAAGASASV